MNEIQDKSPKVIFISRVFSPFLILVPENLSRWVALSTHHPSGVFVTSCPFTRILADAGSSNAKCAVSSSTSEENRKLNSNDLTGFRSSTRIKGRCKEGFGHPGERRSRRLEHPSLRWWIFVCWPHRDNSERITFLIPVKGSKISIFRRPISEIITEGTVKKKRLVFHSVLQMNTNLCSPSRLIWCKKKLEFFPFAEAIRKSCWSLVARSTSVLVKGIDTDSRISRSGRFRGTIPLTNTGCLTSYKNFAT
jgi:hypothetical protein